MKGTSTARRVGSRAAVLAAAGWLVPVAARVISESYYSERRWGSIVSDAAAEMFAPGDNLFLVGAMNAVPFGLAALLAEVAIALRPSWRKLIWASTVVLAAVMVGFTALVAFSVWNPLFGPGRASSTAVIAFAVVPMMITFTLLVLYAVGVENPNR